MTSTETEKRIKSKVFDTPISKIIEKRKMKNLQI